MNTLRRFIAWLADDPTETDGVIGDEQLFTITTLEDAARVAMAAHFGCAR